MPKYAYFFRKKAVKSPQRSGVPPPEDYVVSSSYW